MSHESVAEQVLAEVQAQTAPEAPTPEAAPDAELAAMQAAMEDDGAEVKVEEATPGEAPRKRGLSWEQAVKSVPPDIAKLMRSMHADYTRKTQELSSQRKDFVREREALMRGKKALTTREELPEYDPFNEDSINAYLTHIKWIQPGATYHDLNEEQTTRIMSNQGGFLSAANDHKEGK